MTQTAQAVKPLRVLLACARPLASKTLKLQIQFEPGQDGSAFETVDSLLRNDLKLTILGSGPNGNEAAFRISAPFPTLDYLRSKIGTVDGVLQITPTTDSNNVDVIRSEDEFGAVLNAFKGMGKSVQVSELDHVQPQQLRDQLDSMPGYDILYLVCHGTGKGLLLLEEGQGWTRYMGSRELAELVGGKVKVLVLGACHGELSLEGLLAAEEGDKPKHIIFTQGEHPIPVRAVQLFNEGFFPSLANGVDGKTAFNRGVDRVRLDDRVGEIASPDGMEDFAPSPYKRLQSFASETVVFDAIQQGELDVKALSAPPVSHRKIIRSDELMLGREAEIVIVGEQLLPPKAASDSQRTGYSTYTARAASAKPGWPSPSATCWRTSVNSRRHLRN